MAFQKDFLTPAGNSLGTFAVIVGIIAQHTTEGLMANQAAVAFYNSAADAEKGKPNTAIFRYPLGNIPYSPLELKPVIEKLLELADTGQWNPNRGDNDWKPGFTGAELVPNPPGLGIG